MKKSIITIALFAGALFYNQVSAQTATPVVKEREKNQHERIVNGVKSGELTPAERERLAAEQAKIRHDKHKAKEDGVVTPGEREKLEHEQNKASRDIRRQKHDGQVRH